MKTLTVFFILLAGGSFAQRDASSTMFWNNYTNINPAMSGMEHEIHGSVMYRNELPALTNSNQTIFANFNMRIGDKHGLGINFANERFAIWKNTTVNANYNYQMKLGDEAKLSVGVAASYFNSREDWGMVTFGDVPGGSQYNTNDVNANIGTAYTWKNLLVHGSVTNIFNSVLSPIDVSNVFYSSRSFYLGAAYDFQLGKRFSLKPQLLGQHIDGFNLLHLNAQFSFDNKYWVGASFANRDHYGFMAGWNIYDKFRLAYSYDKTISALENFNVGGSHEFSIGFYLR